MTDTGSDRHSPPTSPNTHDPATSVSLPATPTADLLAPFAELGRIVLGEQSLGAVLQLIAELARRIVPGADEASITLIERRRASSVAFTGNLAVDLDERQYADGFGPGMDAAISGQVITVEDTANSGAYPDFGRQAQRHGIHHTLSVGMETSRDISGAMNIYGADCAGPFSPAAQDIATNFASYAAIALLNAATHAAALNEVAQMRQAMASRAAIEQAKGMLMHERHCTADEAFTLLKTLSSHSNRKLRDVAQAILDNAHLTPQARPRTSRRTTTP